MVGMEAAAVKAAVSVTLNLVCNKLAPLVIKEYSSIVGVEKDLRELQDLALEINQRLEAAGDRATEDALFLKKLKEAVYEVEDAVDEFQLKAEKYEADADAGFLSKYLHTKPKSLIFQCQAAKKIKKIKKMFDVLVKQRSILNSVVGNDSVSHIKDTPSNTQTLPIVDEAAVIGRDQEMHHVISKLLEKDDQHGIKIVSIVGLGGSGKTTLAQLVFKKVETMDHNNFTVKLWVHVSQEKFQLEKILKKLFEAISSERSEGLPLMNMVNKILEKLTNKRFLLVLDDVWVEDRNKWEEFMVYLKNGSSGSRILLTTRSRNVAVIVESTTVIDLPLLSMDYSWQVFQQSFGNAVKDLDSEFQEVGKQIVNKCGGMPLAIKVIAGCLRDKKRVEQWHAIKHNNLLDVDDKERQVSACLWLSYFNLPSHLKQCFTMCSIFPKGRLIDKDQLIDQWIAHGMIPEGGVNYLEYVGDDYFSHLVQMHFLQYVKGTWFETEAYMMHDLVHDLARSILGNEISLDVPKKAMNCTKICRYFSIMKHTRHLPPKNTFQKARAMYIAENDDFIFGKATKNAKHLRSITVKHVHTSTLAAMLQTKNLRYLNISGLKHEALPEVISDIWCLQALHVTHSDLVKLPKSIGKLQKLRVVNLSWCKILTSLPDSIGNCVMISRIELFGCEKVSTLPMSIYRNKRLRVLRLGYSNLERLPSSITTLESLECLDLQSCSNLVELPEGIGNLKKLVVLNLKNCKKLQAIPKGISQLTRLETLRLFVMGEDDENYAQISELENINKISGELTIHGIAHCMDPDVSHKELLKQKTNLQSLTLICAGDMGMDSENHLEGLEPPPGIEKLKIVRYSSHESMQWMFRFRLLREFELSNFPKLELLEGLTELPRLEKLVLKEMTALKRITGLTELPRLEKLVLEKMTALKRITGGPFPSLLELYMTEMPSLSVAWILTEASLTDVERGQLQIDIFECPKLTVMPYFPLSLNQLRISRSNVQLLELSGVDQRSSLPSSSVVLPCFSFSYLKELLLYDMPPPTGVTSYGSGCRWDLLQHLTALEVLKIEWCHGLTELPESMRSLASLRTLWITFCITLRMLPAWLAELSYLESMEIGRCDSLSLAPSGWVGDLCSPSLQTLSIQYCDSISSLPQSFRQLTSLRNLVINGCSDFHQLPECLGELRSLQMLCIRKLPKLSSLPQSLRYLTSLQRLEIVSCLALVQLPDCVGELHSLRRFLISLKSLTCLPQSLGHLTSLQELLISSCEALGRLPESLGELHSLRKFEMYNLPGLTSIPKSMCCLTSLEQLKILHCPSIRSLADWIKGLTSLQELRIKSWLALAQLPDCVGELHSLRVFSILCLPSLICLPQSLGRLSSLQELRIEYCEALGRLPESLGELRSLRELQISNLPALTSFPKSMCCLTSLEQLGIIDCPRIKSLAEWIKCLTALQKLLIYRCPHLKRRCERWRGKDWHLISHIPDLKIW